MRTAIAAVALRASRSRRAARVQGSTTKAGRFSEPRLHAPQAGSGTSPQGLVATMSSQYQRLFARRMRSTKRTPGSAQSYAARTMRSQSSAAGTCVGDVTGACGPAPGSSGRTSAAR